VKTLRNQKISLSEYSGPGSIHSLVLFESAKRKIPALSLWGHVPEYIQDAYPVAVYGVLQRLQQIMEIDVDLSDLKRESDSFARKLTRLMKKDRRLSGFIESHDGQGRKGDSKPRYIG
jgi:proteasome assembly chaperone (PAC2) family protein